MCFKTAFIFEVYLYFKFSAAAVIYFGIETEGEYFSILGYADELFIAHSNEGIESVDEGIDKFIFVCHQGFFPVNIQNF